MYIDAFSLSAFVISLLVLVVVVVIVRHSRAQMRKELRRFLDQQERNRERKEVDELCSAIRDLYPQACPGIDFTVHKTPHAETPSIRDWYLKHPRPSADQLADAVQNLRQTKPRTD